ncbi:hypothetical protein CBR_g46250 [Chara braunii]|uniref:Reverse transcriptase/retrotransposon-derived protein RNase H-like domain-containing protein n=1 Tax=Chara braunii TaxID=69332 RepID=A0A388K3T4_CHABU|nr:hypothetical protein CBR_g46250 [Chara braunii]|eukprot:GBG64707.1 hypothetical protein CBR_g46250 [Chara braunii]
MAIVATSGLWKEAWDMMMRKYLAAEKMATEAELAAVQRKDFATYNDFLREFTLVALRIAGVTDRIMNKYFLRQFTEFDKNETLSDYQQTTKFLNTRDVDFSTITDIAEKIVVTDSLALLKEREVIDLTGKMGDKVKRGIESLHERVHGVDGKSERVENALMVMQAQVSQSKAVRPPLPPQEAIAPAGIANRGNSRRDPANEQCKYCTLIGHFVRMCPRLNHDIVLKRHSRTMHGKILGPLGERINWNSPGGMHRAVIAFNNLDAAVVEAEPVAELTWGQAQGRGPHANFIMESDGRDRVNVTTRQRIAAKKVVQDAIMEDAHEGPNMSPGVTESDKDRAYGKPRDGTPVDKATTTKKKFRYQIPILATPEIDDTLSKLLGTMVSVSFQTMLQDSPRLLKGLRHLLTSQRIEVEEELGHREEEKQEEAPQEVANFQSVLSDLEDLEKAFADIRLSLPDREGGEVMRAPPDLYSGYDQLPLDVRDRSYTPMHMPVGQLQMQVTSMSFTNAVTETQRRMLAIARDMFPARCEPYIDDNPIKGAREKDETEVQPGVRKFVWDHLQDIKELLRRFLEYNITASGPKSILAVPEVTIMGFHYGAYGRKPDPAKTDKIVQWPTPLRTTTEVRAFLGVVGFWKIFIKGFTKIAEPIWAMIREEGTLDWTEDRETIVQTLKKILISEEVTLVAPCFNDEVGRPFVLETDGGPLAVGGVLIQKGEDGRERPIRFDSRTLNSAERRYSQLKKEVLAILHCLKTFQAYLFGRRFILMIDPTNVVGALKNYRPIDPTVGRWVGFIWQFDYEIERIAGLRNRSDDMSRVSLTPEGLKEAESIDAFLDHKGGTLVVDNEMAGTACMTGELLIKALEKGSSTVVAELRKGVVTRVGRKEEKDAWGSIVGPREERMTLAIEEDSPSKMKFNNKNFINQTSTACEDPWRQSGRPRDRQRPVLVIGPQPRASLGKRKRKLSVCKPSPTKEDEVLPAWSEEEDEQGMNGKGEETKQTNHNEERQEGENSDPEDDVQEVIAISSEDETDEISRPREERESSTKNPDKGATNWEEEFGSTSSHWFEQWTSVVKHEWIIKAQKLMVAGRTPTSLDFFTEKDMELAKEKRDEIRTYGLGMEPPSRDSSEKGAKRQMTNSSAMN